MTEINHIPNLNTDKICELYSVKDGVDISYVCTTALGDGVEAVDVFYRATPHPQFGNKYFGLVHRGRNIFIMNADRVETLEFGLVEDDHGKLQYSADRWDYKQFKNGHMIDGGRAYMRSGLHSVYVYVVCNGEMIKSLRNISNG